MDSIRAEIISELEEKWVGRCPDFAELFVWENIEPCFRDELAAVRSYSEFAEQLDAYYMFVACCETTPFARKPRNK